MSTLERVFVVRIRYGKIEWVDVKTGATADKLIEVFGDLREGDMVAVRGTDELRPGMAASIQQSQLKWCGLRDVVSALCCRVNSR